MAGVVTPLQRLKNGCLDTLFSRLACWTKPLRTSLPLSILTDLGRSKSELVAENALLRQQLIILKRHVKRPTFGRTDRILLVLLARLVRCTGYVRRVYCFPSSWLYQEFHRASLDKPTIPQVLLLHERMHR